MADKKSKSKKRRRSTDFLKLSSDHDVLIQNTVKINQLCKLVTGFTKRFDAYSIRLDKRCEQRQIEIHTQMDEVTTETMDKDTFKWLVGFIIIAIFGMTTAIGYNQVQIRGQETAYKFNSKQITKNQNTIEELQRIISHQLGDDQTLDFKGND